MSTTTTEFSQRMRAAREAQGLTLFDVAVESRRLPETYRLTQSMLQRIESGAKAEKDVDLFHIGFLATLYKTTVRALSPLLADQLDSVRDLLIIESGCIVPSAA